MRMDDLDCYGHQHEELYVRKAEGAEHITETHVECDSMYTKSENMPKNPDIIEEYIYT